jgi:magnesium transporter
VIVPTDVVERLRDPARVAEAAAELADLRVPDLADLFNQLRVTDAAALLATLPLPQAINVCDQPSLRRRGRLLEQLDPDRAAAILDGLSADERTDVIQHLSDHHRRRLLPKLSPTGRAEVEQLLRYPDHTAGGIMTTEFVQLAPTVTVGAALQHIRTVAREKETIYAGYVLEPETGRLLGAVSLRDLVVA